MQVMPDSIAENMQSRQAARFLPCGDTALCVEPKQLHDVVGYYNRFDIFNLTVDRSANRPATFVDHDSARSGNPGETHPSKGEPQSRQAVDFHTSP